ncbi:unnamed protein product [Ilex paraguariensis]|uniref:Dirigent protein n=1 Tax=Ilex paraguariensis TaxID=185542 RepID=A0ABC8R9Z5_9AQUA
MVKLSLALILCSMALAMPAVYGIAEGPKEVEEWFQKLSHAKPKLTKLHFYFLQKLNGEKLTAVTVAKANMTDTSPTTFGVINVIDDPMTVEPHWTSKVVGRAQGLYAVASLEEVSLSCFINFVFTEGDYNGSSLTLMGQNPLRHPVREMSIIGGSGVFRMARGVATFATLFFDVPAKNATVDVNIVALHY